MQIFRVERHRHFTAQLYTNPLKSSHSPTEGPQTILHTDDDRTCLATLGFVFGRLEVKSIPSLSGSETLEKYRESVASCKPAALLITDFDMPEMNGVELGSQLRAIGFRGSIIFFTGTPHETVTSECKEKNIDAYAIIAKPNISALVTAIRSALAIAPRIHTSEIRNTPNA